MNIKQISLDRPTRMAAIAALILSIASIASAQFGGSGKTAARTLANANSTKFTLEERSLFPYLDGAVGTLDKVWVEENARFARGETIGIRIHVKFNVKKAINDDCKMVGTFFNAAAKRMDSPAGPRAKAYRSAEGHVIVTKAFSPTTDDMDYADMQLYIPYYAMKPEDNHTTMSFFLSARCGETNFLSSKFVSVDPPPEIRNPK